ncbi:Signal peptidase complex subunit 2 [Modicella reniformis]|uniref:Signal peptidase complex subunit 2 n=1 Tax=Modicella reniformis TaxID=1440133 RepID=A0A9P6M029_9FUNG|nr:Signal peptidase complex subunit 2 [Modicella reniformis]
MTTDPNARVFKADKSSLLDLKNVCDDALKEYLESKGGFRQSHKHTDIKLVLGYLGCIFAAAGSYYGYIHPFELPETKFWTGNGKIIISVNSSVQGYDPYYDLDIHMVATGSSGSLKSKKTTHQQFSTALRFWFDEDGVLAQDQFEADILKFLANTEATHIE